MKWGDLSFLWNECSKICNSVFEQNKNSEDFFEYTGNTFLFLNHHKYFDSYMNRYKPNRNQFKLKCFKPKVFILKPILEKCALKCVFWILVCSNTELQILEQAFHKKDKSPHFKNLTSVGVFRYLLIFIKYS